MRLRVKYWLLLFYAALSASAVLLALQYVSAQQNEEETAAADSAIVDSVLANIDSTALDTLDKEELAKALAAAKETEAEDDPPFKDSLFATPYHTIYHHLFYLQNDENRDELEAARALNMVILNNDGSTNERRKKERAELSAELKQILDGHGIYIYLEHLPRNPNYVDTSNGQHKYLLSDEYPDIYLTKSGDTWLYSKRTVKAIPEMYENLYPFGSAKLVESLKFFDGATFLGLYIWQYLLMALMFGLCYAVHLGLTQVMRLFVKGATSRWSRLDIPPWHILSLARPLSVLVILYVVELFVPLLQFPPQMNEYVVLAFKVLKPVLVIVILYRVIDLVGYISAGLAEKTESTMDDQLIPLVKTMLKVILIIGGVLLILDNLNYDITAVLAGISIGGLALALAAQETLKNFFGSLMIFIDRPFQIGDWIKYNEGEGVVEQVGMRSTRIRTFYDSLIYVPNGNLADLSVDNYGLRAYRRYYTTLGLMYDTPPHMIEAFVAGLRAIVQNHPRTRKDKYEIHFNEFAGSSLNIMFYIFFHVPTWSDELKARHEVCLAILKLAHEIGVNFAFPTQTIHIENLPGQNSLSPEYELNEAEAKRKAEAFPQTLEKNWTDSWKNSRMHGIDAGAMDAGE